MSFLEEFSEEEEEQTFLEEFSREEQRFIKSFVGYGALGYENMTAYRQLGKTAGESGKESGRQGIRNQSINKE